MRLFGRKKEKEKQVRKLCFIDTKENISEQEIDAMATKIREAVEQSVSKEIVVLCIGTDRSIGDSLGPLVGTMLQEAKLPCEVYGTLEKPVHALNLDNVLKEIKKKYNAPFIFGIDACLGDEKHIGYIFLKEGSFLPGNALNKVLPEVGDYHLRAIVNYLDPLSPSRALNDTRLNTVMNLSKLIAKMISSGMQKEKSAAE